MSRRKDTRRPRPELKLHVEPLETRWLFSADPRRPRPDRTRRSPGAGRRNPCSPPAPTPTPSPGTWPIIPGWPMTSASALLAGTSASTPATPPGTAGGDPDPRAGRASALRRRPSSGLADDRGAGLDLDRRRGDARRPRRGADDHNGDHPRPAPVTASPVATTPAPPPIVVQDPQTVAIGGDARRHPAEPRPGRHRRDLHHHAPAPAGQHDLQPRDRRARVRPAPGQAGRPTSRSRSPAAPVGHDRPAGHRHRAHAALHRGLRPGRR